MANIILQADDTVTFPLIAGPKGDKGDPGPAGMGSAMPCGRLTLVSGVPEMPMTTDYSSTTLYYAPYNGATVPVYDGSAFGAASIVSGPTDAVGLSMSGGSKWAANTKRDVFVAVYGGATVLGTGPAWPSQNAPKAARGIASILGLPVNAATMTLDLSESVSIEVPAWQATWVGSIDIGVTAGLLQAFFTFGQNRRCDVWNAHNRRPIKLGVGCPPASASLPVVWLPPTQYPAWQAFNNDIANSGTYFTGDNEPVSVEYHQSGFINTQGSYGPGAMITTVAKNTTGNSVGFWGKASSDTIGLALGVSATATYLDRDNVGSNKAIMAAAGANNFNGVTLTGFDPRSNWGKWDLNHIMWIEYQG